MSQTEHPKEKCDYPPLPPNAENTDGPSAPKHEKIACHNIENAEQFWRRWVARPIACIVRWIDKHDGVVTAAATVAIAFLTWSLSQDSRRQADTANDQFKIMKGQLDAMEADGRPWVSANPNDGIGIAKPLTFDAASGASLEIRYKVRNTGKSPALHVRFRSKIVILPMATFQTTEMAESQDAFCNPMRTISSEFYDAIIFPGDELGANWPVSASPNDIESGLKRRESGAFAHKGFISPSLIVCIDYQFASDPTKDFQTRYAFILGVPLAWGGVMGDIKPEGTRADVRLVYFSQSAD